jgi:hypothetical protein
MDRQGTSLSLRPNLCRPAQSLISCVYQMDRQGNSLSPRPNLCRPAQPLISRVYQMDRHQGNSLSLKPYLSRPAQPLYQSRVYQTDRLGPSLGHSANVYAYFSFINKFIQHSTVVSIKGTDQPQPRPQRKCLRKLLLHQQVQPTRLRTPHSRVCKRDRLGHSLGPSLNVRACFNRTNSTPASALTLNKNKRLQVEQVQEDKKAPASRRE